MSIERSRHHIDQLAIVEHADLDRIRADVIED
jgi:hypothetical protein